MRSTRSLLFMERVRSPRNYSVKGWASIGKPSVGICARWALRPSIRDPSLSSTEPKGRGVSVLTAPHHQCVSESYLGHRYHIHPLAGWLDVSGGHSGLVFSVCDQLGTRSDVGVALCLDHSTTRVRASGAADLQ